jgi:phospholipid/cholesterol/gamma-HCH transport system permease protein
MGGLVVGMLGLNLTLFTYVQQTIDAMTLFDIGAGFAKSVVFAAFIAAIGCQRGFQVKGGAEAVGNATTSAVVSAIFLIIVIDSTFAIILHYIQ